MKMVGPDYDFLSNFYFCRVEFEGLVYDTVEAAFQSAKTVDMELREPFTNMNPGPAKKAGRQLELRPDWEDVKIDVMRRCLRSKFSDPGLMHRLRAVSEPIVEDNSWGDRFWGRVNGRGENWLGRLLEEIRDSD